MAEQGGRFLASMACLPPAVQNVNPITNLGRTLFRSESYADGSAAALLGSINEMAGQRGHLVVGRVPASDNPQQILFEIIDNCFQDQKVGMAIVNLLRSLSIFAGLGDGELRKTARLCTQKLVRPGEKVFRKGDPGTEAYVVMRGQVDILIEEQSRPVAAMSTGHIFGEQAFLDSTTRVASAVAAQPTILLVVQRSAFNRLVQSEPHLGMVVMRNVAMELSNKLRQANLTLALVKGRI